MFPPCRLLKIFICFAAALAWALTANNAAAQGLEIAWERTHVTLSYPVDPNVLTELQASLNLLEWAKAFPVSETVTENPDGTKMAKATIVATAESMFFRLRHVPTQRLTVAWDGAADSAVTGYIIRLRRRGDLAIRRIDAGNTTTATLVIPEDGGLYSFDVISYNGDGLESEPSNAIAIVSHRSACE